MLEPGIDWCCREENDQSVLQNQQVKAETLLGISVDFVINLGVSSLIAVEVIMFQLGNHVLPFVVTIS